MTHSVCYSHHSISLHNAKLLTVKITDTDLKNVTFKQTLKENVTALNSDVLKGVTLEPVVCSHFSIPRSGAGHTRQVDLKYRDKNMCEELIQEKRDKMATNDRFSQISSFYLHKILFSFHSLFLGIN